MEKEKQEKINRLKEFLTGDSFRNKEEELWFKQWKKKQEEKTMKFMKDGLEYEERLQNAKKEADKLLFSYIKDERYCSYGYFNSEEFRSLKRKVDNEIADEMFDIINDKNDERRYIFLIGGTEQLNEYHCQEYIILRRQEVLKEKYNIDFDYYKVSNLPENYHKRIKEIEEKYKVKLFKY